MSVLDKIKVKAKADVKHVVLPEGEEERTIRAAEIITKEGIAKDVYKRQAPGCRIIAEHAANLPPETPLGFTLCDRRKYGIAGLSIFEEERA